MNSHSSLQGLAATLAEKQEQDRKQIEALTRSALQQLAATLQQQSSDALASTLSAIESELNERLSDLRKQIAQQSTPLAASLSAVQSEVRALQALTFQAWLKPLLLSLSLLLGIFCASWGLMQWFSHSIEEQLETRAGLAQEIREQEATLAKIEARTWGVTFREDKDGRFLILPPGVAPVTGWTVGKRHAVKLGKN